jgi:energy-coupling factor transport system ATP-binding protein
VITLSNVSYTYPNAPAPALSDVSLTIPEGEFLLVCGPSGAGKSTLLRLLNGLVPHFYGGRFAGEVRLWGRSTLEHQPRDLADLVGFVFQDPEAQFVVDEVEDEIVFGMENLGLPPKLMRRRVEEVLDQLGIAHLRRRALSTLSGGERQRVAIAAVLAAQPRALVLDEPTSQLDPHAAEEVLSALEKLNADLGLTVVLCEHRLERVVQYADRVVYLGGDHETRDTRHEADENIPFSPSRPLESRPLESRPLLVVGAPREVLPRIPLVPPLVAVGRALGWQPLPLTIKEGRRFAAQIPGRRPQAADEPPASPNRKSQIASRQSAAARVSGVTFRYGEREALFNLSLELRAGELLALMGRNGSGKSTLLRLLIGLLRPSAGRVEVLGRDIAGVTVEELAGRVGYVPQDPRSLLFHDTVREELLFTLRAQKTADRRPQTVANSERQRDQRTADGGREGSELGSLRSAVSDEQPAIDETLAQLGLTHLAEAYPRALSGGEAQRAALAAVLVANPPLLLLDEPTRGLDYAAKARLAELLRAQCAAGRSVLMATHDVELVAACADRVALLGDGELVAEGPVRELLGDSLIFSSQVAKLFPGTGWITAKQALTGLSDEGSWREPGSLQSHPL